MLGIDPDTLILELTPAVERLVDRHLSASREWFPHEMIPWDRADDRVADSRWDPADSDLTPGARAALEVNLLTEDNLPYYFREGKAAFGHGEVWEFWMRRWTAEEARHSVAIRDYVTVTRAVDPVALERDRMTQMTTGWTLDADAERARDRVLGYIGRLERVASRLRDRRGEHPGSVEPGAD